MSKLVAEKAERLETQRKVTAGLLAGGVGLLYYMPVTMGLGDHWKLDNEEGQAIGEAIADCLPLLPKKMQQQILEILKYQPVAVLAMTLYQITAERVVMTQQILAERKRQKNGQVFNFPQGDRQPERAVADERSFDSNDGSNSAS